MKPVRGEATPVAMSSTSAVSRASIVILGSFSARFLSAWMSFSGTIRSISFPPCGVTRLDILGFLVPFELSRNADLPRRQIMKTAFLLLAPAPATRARVLARLDRRRAGPATDGRIVLIVERVVRHVVFVDVRPHVARRPGDE